MNMMSFNHATTSEAVPVTTHRVEARLDAIAAAIDPHARTMAIPLPGGRLIPSANLILAGTNCARPMWYPECTAMVEATNFDLVLMRFDPDRGASFDILDHQSLFWCIHHMAWRRRGGDLWFIPQVGSGPYIRATAGGLRCEATPPFHSLAERHAGIIRAIDSASFEGRI